MGKTHLRVVIPGSGRRPYVVAVPIAAHRTPVSNQVTTAQLIIVPECQDCGYWASWLDFRPSPDDEPTCPRCGSHLVGEVSLDEALRYWRAELVRTLRVVLEIRQHTEAREVDETPLLTLGERLAQRRRARDAEAKAQ